MTDPTSPTTSLHEPVNPSKYPALSKEELLDELASVVGRLSASYTELSAVKVQYLLLYHRAYQASHEQSHVAKDMHAQRYAFEIKEDEIRLEANIDSLSVLRDLLVTLLNARG